MMLRITPRGQVELLASNFRNPIPTPRDIRDRLMPRRLARFRRFPA